MKSVKTKREEEKETLELMVRLYCNKNHGTKDVLCDDCSDLLDYALTRVDKCPFMETKTFCSNCKVHCYKPSMREKIRQVMRFSGPRMLFHHPVMAMRHVIETKKEKKKLEKAAGWRLLFFNF
ncbi:MAG: nitrous oxide-stimulated promoter family protein [Phoenicibacter congonensis]|uniref:Nitrous oxide-stimulated promoter family protein n=1 Tax=Phoenicibacter congonensis TaxID=1944646 RepID=A0AA43RMK6_9ACTN|nr:nitrous oxide-stimulated promoter family protein [Phoenicibacter congonensis]